MSSKYLYYISEYSWLTHKTRMFHSVTPGQNQFQMFQAYKAISQEMKGSAAAGALFEHDLKVSQK